jgi:hypothetical protein
MQRPGVRDGGPGRLAVVVGDGVGTWPRVGPLWCQWRGARVLGVNFHQYKNEYIPFFSNGGCSSLSPPLCPPLSVRPALG